MSFLDAPGITRAGLDAAATALQQDPDSEFRAAQNATYAGVGSGNIQATARKLTDAYEDVTIQMLGDSTIAQWLPSLLDQIKTMHPHRSIRTYTWDDTAKAYGAAVTYFTGSGATWLNVYDGSKGGTIWEFAYLNADKKFASRQPDCTIIGYGLNQGNTASATARLVYRQEWQRLASVVKASAPNTDLLLVSQNPRIDAGYQQDLATVRAQAVRSVAAEMGAAYGPVTEAYLATGSVATHLEADGVHPNTAGKLLYGSTLIPMFKVNPNMQPSARVVSPLLTTGSEIGVNGDFASFPGALTGWTLMNCAVSKDTTNYESVNGYAVKITANAAAQSRIEQLLPVNRVKGRWVTVAARMWIPAGMSNVTGRTEISTTGGAATVFQQSPGTQATIRDCWIWEYTTAFIPADAATVKVKVIAGATNDATAQVTVDRVFIGLGNQPHDVVSRTALPATTTAPADGLTTGQMVPSRELMNTNTVSHSSGTLALAYFTADKTETINTLTAYTGTVAAAATPTLCRMGIYEIDASGNGTLVASTPNDTTLFAATNIVYAKALSAPFTKTAGQRYATAILVTSGVTMPNFHGPLAVATGPSSTVAQLGPATIGRITAQTDLPASFTAAGQIGYQLRSHMLLS